MQRFDPGTLARVHEDPSEAGRSYVLRRGAELAVRAAAHWSKPSSVWLDIGCGSGHLTARLAAAGLAAVGADRDPGLARAAQARWQGMPFTAGDATALPFADSSADGLVAVSLAGCVDDLQVFLAEAHRVIRPGGTLLLTVSNRDSLLLRVNGRLRRLLDPSPDPRRYRLYSANEITDVLHRTGLRVQTVRRYGYVLNVGSRLLPPAPIAERFESEASLRGSRWARNLLITARR